MSDEVSSSCDRSPRSVLGEVSKLLAFLSALYGNTLSFHICPDRDEFERRKICSGGDYIEIYISEETMKSIGRREAKRILTAAYSYVKIAESVAERLACVDLDVEKFRDKIVIRARS